jgi:hypothetical protein
MNPKFTVPLFEIFNEFSFIFHAENGHIAIDYKAFWFNQQALLKNLNHGAIIFVP